VTGVPKQRKDHAVIMARFARDAMDKFAEIICDLELKLGPDTVRFQAALQRFQILCNRFI